MINNDKQEQRKKISKNQIILSLVLAFLLLATYGFYQYKTVYSNETNIKVEKYLKNTKKYDGLEINHISFFRWNTKSYIKFQINNNNNEAYASKKTYLIFLDAVGKTISKKEINIPKINKNSKVVLKIQIDKKSLRSHTFILSDV